MTALPLHTQIRVAIVEKIAEWLKVPVLILMEDIPEHRLEEIKDYLEECEELFGPIFDRSKLPAFRQWAEQFLTDPEMNDNPFLLHSDPLDFVMDYLGIRHYGDTVQEYYSTWERYDQWLQNR